MRHIGRHEVGRRYKQAAEYRKEGLEKFRLELARLGDQALLNTLKGLADRGRLEAERGIPMATMRLQGSPSANSQMNVCLKVISDRVQNNGGPKRHPLLQPVLEEVTSLTPTTVSDPVALSFHLGRFFSQSDASGHRAPAVDHGRMVP